MNSPTQVLGAARVPASADIQRQIERIAASSGFKNSDPIRSVLLFLAQHAVEFPGRSVKEHEIATSALGRSADFDPREDSTVRVTITRLRAKLAEYYTHEGAHDAVLVDVPKGAYLLSFSLRAGAAGSLDGLTESLERIPAAKPDQQDRLLRWQSLRSRAFPAMAFLVAAVAFWAGRVSNTPRNPRPVTTFWEPLLRGGDPLIVFSNPIFQGTPEGGMHLLDPGAFHTDGTNETFTGVGEVTAVQALTRELFLMGHIARLKRARLFTWDEALANNVIIVGGPAQSSVFTQLPQLQNFVLKSPSETPYTGQEAVRDAEASGSAPKYFLPVRRADGGTEFAIVALTPGASSEHSILIVAGTSTYGTEAAARFLCDPKSLDVLLSRLHVGSSNSGIPPFEALLKVEVRGGAPLEANLLQITRRSL